MKINWHASAWEEYVYWQGQDRKTLKRINRLIDSIVREGVDKGLGSPEKLRGDLSGYFSREINEKDRLIYTLTSGGVVEVVQCKGHYDDK